MKVSAHLDRTVIPEVLEQSIRSTGDGLRFLVYSLPVDFRVGADDFKETTAQEGNQSWVTTRPVEDLLARGGGKLLDVVGERNQDLVLFVFFEGAQHDHGIRKDVPELRSQRVGVVAEILNPTSCPGHKGTRRLQPDFSKIIPQVAADRWRAEDVVEPVHDHQKPTGISNVVEDPRQHLREVFLGGTEVDQFSGFIARILESRVHFFQESPTKLVVCSRRMVTKVQKGRRNVATAIGTHDVSEMSKESRLADVRRSNH